MQKPFHRSSTLWCADEKYSNHRIPGMIVTDKGTLLVYCEARQTPSDYALMDVMMQRSTDHGETFSSPILLAEGNTKHNTVNNPVMVQDKNGRIHFLYCEDYTLRGGRILRRYSDDDGITWSDPIDITAFADPDYHNAFALGPGHGIVTKEGVLLIPIWMVPKKLEVPEHLHVPSVLSTFYSTDNGESWQIGELLKPNDEIFSPNETEAALTSDGRVYLNIRMGSYCRANAYSANGYSAWTDYKPVYALHDPQCFGSVISYDDGEHPYSLIFANCATKTSRTHVTVRISQDDGRSFPISRLLDEERGGYVELAQDPSAKLIYVLYEDKGGETDHLVVCNYEWLTAAT